MYKPVNSLIEESNNNKDVNQQNNQINKIIHGLRDKRKWVQFFCLQIAIFIGLLISKNYNYNLFHTLVEGYTITVSVCIFFIVVNSNKTFHNNFLKILSIGYLFIAIIDSIHTLTYTGMNIFTGFSLSLPTQLWTFSRYIQCTTLLAAVFLAKKKVKLYIVYGSYTMITCLGLYLIFTLRFPPPYLEGVGFTPIKIISEYIITVITLLAFFLLFLKKDLFDTYLIKCVYLSLSFFLISELTFALYTDPFAIENLFGHYFKYLSVYFIYKAVIQLSIKYPQAIIFRELTQKKNDLEQEIRDNVSKLEIIKRKNIALIDNFQEQVYVLDKNLILKECNLPKINLLKVNPENIINKSIEHAGVPESVSKIMKDALKKLLRTGNPERVEYYIDLPEKRYWFDAQISMIPGGEFFEDRILWTARDITSRVEMEESNYNEKEQFKTTLLSVGDGIIATDSDGNIIIMNPIAEKLTEWTSADAYKIPVEEVFHVICEDTKEECKNMAKKVLASGEIHELSNHSVLISRLGKEIPIEDSAAPIRDRKGQINGVVIVFRDCTERKLKQKQIEYLSFHDYLTGLYNRRYMEDSLKRLDTERNMPLTIMALDVNGLKLTNDAFGHEIGDQLIKAVANILRKVCRADDIISRVGGDEFTILLPNTDDNYAENIKRRIADATMNEKIDSAILSLAIGYSVKYNTETDIEVVEKEADNNMYKDKIKYGKMMRSQTIETLLRNINNKYDNEQIHTERVSQFCVAIARTLGLGEKEINDIKIAGILHDIGKIIIPPELLNKESKLSENEIQMICQHTQTGYQILKGVDEYAAFAEAVLYHHERWDGNGYPRGFKGEQIPLFSRIISIADAYEAMTSKRPYQKKKSQEEAVEEIKRCSGTQFDPVIADIFIEKILKKKVC